MTGNILNLLNIFCSIGLVVAATYFLFRFVTLRGILRGIQMDAEAEADIAHVGSGNLSIIFSPLIFILYVPIFVLDQIIRADCSSSIVALGDIGGSVTSCKSLIDVIPLAAFTLLVVIFLRKVKRSLQNLKVGDVINYEVNIWYVLDVLGLLALIIIGLFLTVFIFLPMFNS